jgi:AcrR family transcriptional regulator
MARPRFNNLDGATRARILETAAVEFASNGFEGTSLNRLIDDLGISKGSFYYYFDDKADLFSTVVDHAWEIFFPEGSPDISRFDRDTYWPILEGMMAEARTRIRSKPWLVGFTRMIYDPPNVPGIREALAERFDTAREFQAELIRRGQELGTVRDDLPVGLLQALLIGADEATDRWFVANWDRHDDNEIERLSSEVFAIFRRMMEPTPDQTSCAWRKP